VSYTNAQWEKLSIFLTFLVPKLPAPAEEDLSRGILEAIDIDSYRVEKQTAMRIQLPDQDGEIGPVPTSEGGRKPEPELERLSNILRAFNDQFGNIEWTDTDRIHRLITEEIPARVSADTAYRNAIKNSDKQNARIEHNKALVRVMTALLRDDTELFKQFSDNDSFKRWLTDTMFSLTYASQSNVADKLQRYTECKTLPEGRAARAIRHHQGAGWAYTVIVGRGPHRCWHRRPLPRSAPGTRR